VPIGIFAISCLDTAVAFETCEELFTPNAPNALFSLDGVEIIANGSGSHHKLRKLDYRVDLIRGAAAKAGGVYLYANQKGCDGGRLYYDGCAMVWINGELVAQGSQFEGLDEVELVVATVDLADVRTKRANFISRSFQASSAPRVPRIEVPFRLCDPNPLGLRSSVPRPPHLHDPMEEIALGPSGWLWDYLRRTRMRGFFLPLSGGADSSSTACLVAIMCQRVVHELQHGSERSKAKVLADVRSITRRPQYTPSSWRDLCGKIFVTCYMASEHSGDETRERALMLAKAIGAMHTSIYIDAITDAIKRTFEGIAMHADFIDKGKMRMKPSITGSSSENLAMQNIQARSRMVMSYFLAQLMPWATDGDQTTAAGSLLVLGSANVDEALRGYYTKYDCSAADINPIGGVNKRDLKDFLSWAASRPEEDLRIAVLQRVADAKPSAELTGAEGEQSDEVDMGMSYDELGDLGTARKVEHCGPLSMFLKLRDRWADGRPISASIRATGAKAPRTHDEVVAQKVKDFCFFNAINRHKMTTLTPSYHAEDYSPDDNRFDLRPFMQPCSFDAQFAAIDAAVAAAAAGAPSTSTAGAGSSSRSSKVQPQAKKARTS
jgi:NAD+ synthase (glutamine-hydrolysing)